MKRYFSLFFKIYKIKDVLLFAIIMDIIADLLIHFRDSITSFRNEFGQIFAFLIAIFFILVIIKPKYHKLLEPKMINYFDFILLSTNISLLIGLLICRYLFVAENIENIESIYKVCFSLLIIFFIFLCVRIEILNKSLQEASFHQNNQISLIDLYNGNIEDVESQFFLIKDKDVDCDILFRSGLINKIANAIKYCDASNSYVISISGEWGSGKTTIINNVKKIFMDNNDEEIIFIENFNPWEYNNHDDIKDALFNSILGIIYSTFNSKQINRIKNSLLKISKPILKIDFNDSIEDIDMSKFEDIFNQYVELYKKRIVFVMDNIERCSPEQILNILSFIHNNFNFKNIIYLLSYDETVMKNIFSNNLHYDYSYMDKIVQQEFKIPRIDSDTKQDIVTRCLKNYLVKSQVNIGQKELVDVVNILCEFINTPRDLIRIINSSFYNSVAYKTELNSYDMLLIEVVSLTNQELYNEIANNKSYFVSSYDEFSNEMYLQMSNYFIDLFKSNKYKSMNYKLLLIKLFPNVDYFFNRISIPDFEYKKNTSFLKFVSSRKIDVASIGRIYDVNFFDIYFNKNEDNFKISNIKAKEFVLFFINTNNKGEINKFYISITKSLPLDSLFFFFRYLNSEQFIVDNAKRLMFIEIIYSNITLLSFVSEGLEESIGLIANELNKLDTEHFSMFIKEIEKDYSKLYPIEKITKQLKDKKMDILKNKLNNMINFIVYNDINIYTKEYYFKGNIHTLINHNSNYQNYIIKNIRTLDLNLLLIDFIYCSKNNNNKYFYTLDTSLFDGALSLQDLINLLKTQKESLLNNSITNLLEAMLSKGEKIDNIYNVEINEYIDFNYIARNYSEFLLK